MLESLPRRNDGTGRPHQDQDRLTCKRCAKRSTTLSASFEATRLQRVHDLRHSCATLLFTMGVQPAAVQRILRHSSITVTTGTYVEVIEAVQRDALDSMGTLFAHTGYT
ncbi:MAG: tyrosine-type recombinase/integrase [Mycobacterium sp.]|nr:tyrosine-type recombinase/integrase [Mycobacterium sp.]